MAEYCGCREKYPDNDLGYFNIYKWLETNSKYAGARYTVEHVVIENSNHQDNNRDLYYGRVYGNGTYSLSYGSTFLNYANTLGANNSIAVLLSSLIQDDEKPWVFIGIKITFPDLPSWYGG